MQDPEQLDRCRWSPVGIYTSQDPSNLNETRAILIFFKDGIWVLRAVISDEISAYPILVSQGNWTANGAGAVACNIENGSNGFEACLHSGGIKIEGASIFKKIE